jgi:hypothetical protein
VALCFPVEMAVKSDLMRQGLQPLGVGLVPHKTIPELRDHLLDKQDRE